MLKHITHTIFYLSLALAFALLSGCQSSEPSKITLTTAEWADYKNPDAGYSLRYPSAYRPVEDGKSNVLFKYQGSTPFLVRFVDEAEGKERGLWFGNPAAESLQIAGLPGKEYIYKHYDGPVYSTTVAYVISLKGKWLGLEFRSNGKLNEVEREILASLTID